MKKTKNNTEQIEQGLDYWTNEMEYFLDAQEGLKMAHAIIASMAAHATKKVHELTPDREEV